MRRPLLPAILLATTSASLVTMFAAPAVSQDPQPQSNTASRAANVERYGVAVIDISFIFKNYRKFTTEMEGLKQQLDQIESSLTAERDQINREIEKLGTLKVGEPEYKTQDEKIAEMKAQFNLNAQKRRKQIMEQESDAYFRAYQEVSSVVNYYAQRRNIGMVVRFNREPVNSKQRDHILRAINKPVVYQGGIDITDDILTMLHQGAANQLMGAGGTARSTNRTTPQFPQQRQ